MIANNVNDYIKQHSDSLIVLAAAVFLLAAANFIQDRELKEMEKRFNKIEQTPEIKCD
jgi:hypothetical protein